MQDMEPVIQQGDTATRILDVAERLVQERGFNGFSYADVAAELGVTKASLHYHFATKSDLGEALIERYAARFSGALVEIDVRAPNALEKLSAYAQLYAEVLRAHRMCLCGMMAADYETLASGVKARVVGFFDSNEAWLSGVLEQGRREGTLSFEGLSTEAAQWIIAGLEGAMLLARPYGDVARFEVAANRLLGGLSA
jgi:TetR/AcrR family transcriptional repressor of nem operon